METPTVAREQVLAHRVATQGLHRDGRVDAVVTLGLQDTGPSATVALAARTPPGGETSPAALGLVDAWTHRGAPHHHRPADLPRIAAASRPLSDADAAARLSWSGPEQRRVGIPAAEAIDRAAAALAEVVTEPMTKGAASTEVTRRLPESLLRDCRGCACVHVNEQLMRLSALPAGITLDPTAPTLLLLPPPPGWEPPQEPDPVRAAEIVLAYLRVLGPATRAHAAGFVLSSPGTFAAAWEAALPHLAEVMLDGAPAWLPADDVDALLDPPEPDVVRLLPPSDPLLQGRDRELLVPDPAARKELYRILGNPGAVLADGEIVGTWRPKASGKKLAITVAPFGPLPSGVRSAVEVEAERVAEARGMRPGGVTGW
jgi:hypothetical protein